MGALLSFLWGGTQEDPSLDVPDPATGLSPREKKHVVDSWAIVKKDTKETGIELFMAFFEAYPHHQKNFKSFADLPLSELRHSKRLVAHTNTVMYALTSVVDNLEDPECLMVMLGKMGENHARRKVSEQAFLDLKEVLLQLLKQKLGNVLTTEGEKAWSKTIDIVYKGIFEGMTRPKPQ